MSTKMFWQIVLLIIIAALVSSALRIGTVYYKRSCIGIGKTSEGEGHPRKSWHK